MAQLPPGSNQIACRWLRPSSWPGWRASPLGMPLRLRSGAAHAGALCPVQQGAFICCPMCPEAQGGGGAQGLLRSRCCWWIGSGGRGVGAARCSSSLHLLSRQLCWPCASASPAWLARTAWSLPFPCLNALFCRPPPPPRTPPRGPPTKRSSQLVAAGAAGIHHLLPLRPSGREDARFRWL
jgi:hypothetical protein